MKFNILLIIEDGDKIIHLQFFLQISIFYAIINCGDEIWQEDL